MPRTLFTNNPAFALLFVIFLIGAALFGLGSVFAYRSRAANTQDGEPPASLAWTRAFTEDDEALTWELRLDLVDRLALVGAPWCSRALRAALAEEKDARVLDAAERALIVIESRPDGY